MRLPGESVGRATVASRVANGIREAILRGDLPAGAPLRQSDLAARFGASPIPVREALRRLEAEGLVVSVAYRGAFVAPLSAEEVAEIRDIRLSLETMALRLAVPRMSSAVIARARRILRARDRASEPGRWGELNRRFYATLYAPCRRPRLLSYIATMHDLSNRYLPLLVRGQGSREEITRKLGGLLAACERRDAEAAVRWLEDNYLTSVRRIIDGLQGAASVVNAARGEEKRPWRGSGAGNARTRSGREARRRTRP